MQKKIAWVLLQNEYIFGALEPWQPWRVVEFEDWWRDGES